MPGDCPALSPAELQELLDGAARPGREVVIVPDRHGTGTNGLLLAPPDAIAPSFGPGSFERHRALVAGRAGPSCAWSARRRCCSTSTPAPTSPRCAGGSPAAPAARRGRGRCSPGARRRAAPRRRLRRGAAPAGAGRVVPNCAPTRCAALPEIRPGDDLAALIAARRRSRGSLRDGTVVAIAHKVVSKAEGARGRARGRDSERPRASSSPPKADKDPRAVQVILDETAELVRAERGVLICRTRHGFVCANAGVDASNAPDGDTLVLLPRDPDASARALRARLRELTGARARRSSSATASGAPGATGSSTSRSGWPGWRRSTTGAGARTRGGWCCAATWLAVADAAAAAADLARAKDSREPVVLLEGLERFVSEDDGPGAAALLRAARGGPVP